ncbi:sensor domain-containing diguanylate cyclase [Shewanella sp.]|uniref:sensor domain-containing diguanylate cyclase n=1 Tax=Shewanella sp. TaxID=50422 RepID=UPI004053C3E8
MTFTKASLSAELYLNHSIKNIEVSEIDWDRWQRLVDSIANIFDAPAAFITQANLKGIEILSAANKPQNPYHAGQSMGPEVNIYCHEVVRTAAPLYIKDASQDPKWQNNPELTQDKLVSYLGLPIFRPNGNPFGTLCVMDIKASDYQEQFIELLTVIRDVINSDLSHFYVRNQLLTQSYTDPLTHIYNRRGFSDILIKNRELATRLNQTLVLIYFDINQFKPINDTFGHAVGDAVLANFSARLRQSCRSCDLICRWGGDEFLMLAQIQTSAQLSGFVERLKQDSQVDDLPCYSFSYGYVFISPENTDTFDDLLALADQQMYLNKQQP